MRSTIWTMLVLLLLAGCAHLPTKEGTDPDAGLVVIPIEIKNSSDVPLLVHPFFWPHTWDQKGLTPHDGGMGPNGTRYGDFGIPVETAGKRLVQVVHEDFLITKLVTRDEYRLDGDYTPRSIPTFKLVRHIPGHISVADFRFVLTQTKDDGHHYNYRWDWVPLTEQEQEQILADYRAEKANAAWFD